MKKFKCNLYCIEALRYTAYVIDFSDILQRMNEWNYYNVYKNLVYKVNILQYIVQRRKNIWLMHLIHHKSLIIRQVPSFAHFVPILRPFNMVASILSSFFFFFFLCAVTNSCIFTQHQRSIFSHYIHPIRVCRRKKRRRKK